MTLAASVVVIDDDLTALATTEAQLLAEGHRIELVPGGPAAIERLAGAPADVVICDVMMPELDGYAVARALKAHPEWHYVPVILVTALDGRDALIRGLEAGADEFVTKPVEGPVLRARVRSMLRVRSTYLQLRAAAATGRREELLAHAGLTDREREVLDLLLLGRTHGDIATVLGITERTSKFHQSNLLAKLGAESRLDLMRLLL